LQLRAFGAAVDEQMNVLRAAMSRLGGTWKDDDYREFQAEVAITQQRVRKVVEEVREVTPKRKRDADKLEDYARVHAPTKGERCRK
jgi:hypothetical protein